MANKPNINGEIEINFVAGKMNKDFDERLIPPGQYIDALNIRIGSTELDSVGAIENTKGNTKLTSIEFDGNPLINPECIGVYEDGANETIYWFVCADNVDMILSYNSDTSITKYHVISTSVLNFDKKYLINGINKVDDLLFFTDNLNPPRKINVNRNYPNPVLGVDVIVEKDICVIVSPPTSSPKLYLTSLPGQENYITDKFISFAYRYKYKDNEYSALSQFSDIAFEPNNFRIDYSTYSNAGMVNIFNSVDVEFNVGDHNVIGVDLCFKLSNSNVINVIERYNRKDQGWTIDNSIKTISFTNQKIYTTLSEGELLRLYDNVPKTAKSQSIIGNRLIYGNYKDGYDVGPLDYKLETISEPISEFGFEAAFDSGSDYTIDPTATETIADSNILIDLTGYDLLEGSILSIGFDLIHNSYSGDSNFDSPPFAPGPENIFQYNFIFTLRRNYISVFDLATSNEFIQAISNHELFANCNTAYPSVTDSFNCNAVDKPAYVAGGFGVWEPVGSGIFDEFGGFEISSSVGSNVIGIQIPALKYKTEHPIGSGLYLYGYEYLKNVVTNISLYKLGARRSLHSNMDYEVAIVYMDDFLRSSTALVCNNNTVFLPASTSVTKNYIKTYINNVAPDWATKYKIVVKPSRNEYNTVYTNIFFRDNDATTWFKLDGDNRSKVQVGDILIVKADTSGPLSRLVKAKVLDLKVQPSDFISNNTTSQGQLLVEPSGTYMQINTSNFSANVNPYSVVNYGSSVGLFQTVYTADDGVGMYSLNIPNPLYDPLLPIGPGNWDLLPYSIPFGSRITFYIEIFRSGGTNCDDSKYLYQKEFVASQDYDNFFDFVLGDNVNFIDGIQSGGAFNDNQILQYSYIYHYYLTTYPQFIPYIQGTHQFRFDRRGLDGPMYLNVRSGTPNCSGWSTHISRVSMHIIAERSTSLMVFETEATQADGETYYEGSDSFNIDPITHYHEGSNGVYQTSLTPAVVNLNFFNCFSFGNGVESYKIQDSVVGAPFYLGSRVTAVSKEEFKEADRYAGLTYSGVYNADTNLNKLNEFNLALANWKDCDKSFGPINKIYGRKTDLLLLQEDKISYVLYEKNLLSDAAAGGAITSIPEVLGTQLARIEDYGISNNPESFAVRGSEIFFTDVKRTAVLNLKGGSAQSEQLDVISNLGLKNWFRQEFKNSLGTQKLGAFDPYMNEYVLSINDKKLPYKVDDYSCGVTISQQLFVGTYEFTLELGNTIGEIIFDYNVTLGNVNIEVIYDSVSVIDTLVDGSGVVSFTKDSIYPVYATVILTCSEESSYLLTPNCPVSQEITVVRVVANSSTSKDQTIHNNYRWTLGSFSSYYNSDYVLLEADAVSLFDADTDMSSVGVIPAIGSTIDIDSTKLTGDTFVFDETLNSFRYLVSDTLYTDADILTLLSSSTIATPVINPFSGKYSTSFVYDNPDSKQYLYLIWDYIKSYDLTLCYNATEICCNCIDDIYYIDTPLFTDATAVYLDILLTVKAPDGYYALGTDYRQQLDGILLSELPCQLCCALFTGATFKGAGGGDATIGYTDCEGNPQTFTFPLPTNPEPGNQYTFLIDQEFSPAPCLKPGSIYKISGSGNFLSYSYSDCV